MTPLLVWLCILIGVLGNFWLLAGMPHMALDFIVILGCLVSSLYFLVGLPLVAAIVALRSRPQRRISPSLLVSVLMMIAFYASILITWVLITRNWNWRLSPIQTIRATTDSAEYGKLEDIAEHAVMWLTFVSTVSTVSAGLISFFSIKVWTAFRHKTVE